MSTIDDVVKKIDEATEPDWTWDASKKEVETGLTAINSDNSFTEKTKGADLVGREKDWATKFYSGSSEANDAQKNQYLSELRAMLGDNYGAWVQAVKKGKRHEQARLVANAVENRNISTLAAIATEEAGNLSSDDQISLAKRLTSKFGPKAKEYIEVVKSIPQTIQNLTGYKLQAELYAPKS